jgi:ABC-2 type transport system ATP-binding protein
VDFMKIGLAAALAGLLLCGCGSSSPQGSPGAAAGDPLPSACSKPLPATAVNESLVDPIPQDFDPSVDPAPTTTVFFTVLLPQRCPGETFPLILHSPGFGNSRVTALAADGTLPSNDPYHASIDELPGILPFHGYVVISFDERGLGQGKPDNGGGYARMMDPRAETQDAKAVLDWAYDNAAAFAIQTEPGSGIAKDIRVGLLGASYGGAYQMQLAALDPRVDAIVPASTWHDLLYSAMPGDAVKLNWGGFLSLDQELGNAVVTPLLHGVMNQIGPLAPNTAMLIRTHDDLDQAMAEPWARPAPETAQAVNDFFYTHGMDYFEAQQAAGKPWGFGEAQAVLRPVPTLFLQGDRDLLVNLTEAYWNYQYFAATGADTRLLSNEGGHMDPLADQVAGTAYCGKVDGIASVLAWYDHYLKGLDTPAFQAIPKICISVARTIGSPDVPMVGVLLEAFPVGSLSGPGAVPAQLSSLDAKLPLGTIEPVFVPVFTVQGGNRVLAGAPRIGQLTVAAGLGAVQTAIAQVGVGIRRGGSTFLVDGQLTAFVEGQHSGNRGVAAQTQGVLLPAVGETLQDGDQVGLLFYPQSEEFSAVVSGHSLAGLPGVVYYVEGKPTPPLLSALDPLADILALPNPYEVTASDVELPILIPGQYPGSALSQ